MIFKTLTAEITRGVGVETKTILSRDTQTLQKGSLLCPRNQMKKIFQEGWNTKLHQNALGECVKKRKRFEKYQIWQHWVDDF